MKRIINFFTDMQYNFPLCILVSELMAFVFSLQFDEITGRKLFSSYCGFMFSIFIGIVIKEYLIDKIIKHELINKENIYNDIIGAFDTSLCFDSLTVKIVIDCCAMEIDDEGKTTITLKDVKSKSRRIDLVMTRCILAAKAFAHGFSIETIAKLLKRSVPAVRHLLKLGYCFKKTSKAYNIANREVEEKCEK